MIRYRKRYALLMRHAQVVDMVSMDLNGRCAASMRPNQRPIASTIETCILLVGCVDNITAISRINMLISQSLINELTIDVCP